MTQRERPLTILVPAVVAAAALAGGVTGIFVEELVSPSPPSSGTTASHLGAPPPPPPPAGPLPSIFAVAFAAAALAGAGVVAYRRLRDYTVQAARRAHRQLEALQSLHAVLRLRAPLPPMDGWVVAPDHAAQLVTSILARRPRHVLDLGSGVSTLLAAYALDRLGDGGRVTALDDDAAYAERTRALLRLHRLDHVATVLHAPLVTCKLPGDANRWRWYDLAGVPDGPPLDLVHVDGPPQFDTPLARYPALPLLEGRLAAGAAIILDDAGRPQESAVLARWLAAAPYTLERLDTEHGTAVLTVPSASAPRTATVGSSAPGSAASPH